MVNLLTPETRARLATRYYLRLATVTLVAFGLALALAAVLMLPTYFLIHAEADQAKEYVETANAIAAERAKGAAQETLAAFHEGVKLLTSSASDPSLARIMSFLTVNIPRGVTLSAVDVRYTKEGNASVSVTGVARTRAALIAYSQELKQVAEFRDVSIPVSNLVADVDSVFSITLVWQRPQTP